MSHETGNGEAHPSQKVDLRHAGLTGRGNLSIPQETEELDVRDNALEGLEVDGKLLQLRALYAGRNALAKPPPLATLARLEVLDLSDNRLDGVNLEGLTALRFLNMAGNNLQNTGAISGVRGGCRLSGLDISRNLIAAASGSQSRPFDDLLTCLSHLQLLSLLGNPARLTPGDAARLLPRLSILDGRPVAGRESQGAALCSALPTQAGFGCAASAFAGHSSLGRATIPSSAAPRDGPADIAEALHLRQSTARQGPPPVLDSADDMTDPSGRGDSYSSVSEFGAGDQGSPQGEESSQAPHLGAGMVERQDSANYQPRPPALAERQDSAQNLQAMEEDVAAMAGPSTAATEQPGMARQDSARELDESTRSPSPTRLTTSPGAPETLAPSPFSAHPASPQRNLRRASGSALHVSVRHDSASERLPARLSGGGGDDMDRSPHREPEHDPFSRPTSELGEGSLSRRSSLQAARQVLRSLGTVPRSEPLPSIATASSSHDELTRQDSALDSLSEARGAVLSQLSTPGLPPVSSTDPLQQARRLIQESGGSPMPRRIPQPLSPLLQARHSLVGPSSPFDAQPLPLTPLSPAWTASQLQTSFPQRLPSISSGVAWTLSGESSDQGGESSREAGGGLLAEARRVVLGDPLKPQPEIHASHAGPSSEGLGTVAAPHLNPR